ncbi:MAG: adenylate kinase [Buchnera aphidicola (Pentalonia nigronervosa)]|jgi:adenylate kinase|uniref:Adenylate kinase n=1 Tax=Buchnera aphidicola (Pentalonia nigronervosa) TaxID=1309793 RepID=A0A7H1AYW1_9GAMM|nr:MAG: adenylate kinase [Buchnera aphidicola (Pentalonia nigronervosa)]
MRIVLLGPPGSGKGTQSKFIAERYKIPKISIGDILRENISLKNNIGKNIQHTIKNGNLVSDDIVCNVMKQRIQQKDCINGFLLDGFPRTIGQAKYLLQQKIKIDFVLKLTLPSKLILERLSGRRIHAESGRTYHIKFNPPKQKNKDDITGQILTIRDDDQQASIKKRIQEYQKIDSILEEHYLSEKKLGNIKYFKIDGVNPLLRIRNTIKLILEQQ